MFIVIINNKKKFKIESKENIDGKNLLFVNNKEVKADIKSIDDNLFHIILNDRSYNAEIVNESINDKTFEIKVKGRNYQVKVEDELESILDKLGFKSSKSKEIKQINAPMPGLVTNINVAQNQHVEKGDSLLVLEAMKMENIIKSPSTGIIKNIHVQKSDPVEKGQLLIELE